MILLYSLTALLLLVFLLGTIGRVVQAQDDYRHERMLWQGDAPFVSARPRVIVAWVNLCIVVAFVLGWLGWLVWGWV